MLKITDLGTKELLSSSLSWVKYAPWERYDNYLDNQGRCWFQQYGRWELLRPEEAINCVTCLPAFVNHGEL